jgi:mRNA interferase RelE/StbE
VKTQKSFASVSPLRVAASGSGSKTLYELDFDHRAKKEFDKLGEPIRRKFKKKLVERLAHPRVEADRLSDLEDCYKIKLRSDGYRLIYRVEDDVVVVLVIAVGRRDSSKRDVYDIATDRLARLNLP